MRVEFAETKQANMVNDYPSSNTLEKYLKKLRCPAKPEDVLGVLDVLYAVPTAADLPPMFRYHLLKHKRGGTAAVDIRIRGRGGRGAWRMILIPVSNCGDVNKQSSIDKVIITELAENYHDS